MCGSTYGLSTWASTQLVCGFCWITISVQVASVAARPWWGALPLYWIQSCNSKNSWSIAHKTLVVSGPRAFCKESSNTSVYNSLQDVLLFFLSRMANTRLNHRTNAGKRIVFWGRKNEGKSLKISTTKKKTIFWSNSSNLTICVKLIRAQSHEEKSWDLSGRFKNPFQSTSKADVEISFGKIVWFCPPKTVLQVDIACKTPGCVAHFKCTGSINGPLCGDRNRLKEGDRHLSHFNYWSSGSSTIWRIIPY